MLNNILFVFEGNKEKAVVSSLKNSFEINNTLITSVYCTTIYRLFNDISNDPYLDIFVLLKNMEENKETLKEFVRTDFAEIYLFFDYDGHASNANDSKLQELLTFFNEETENGKLYLSFPMLEAIRHIEDRATFKDLTFPVNKLIDYKPYVTSKSLPKYKFYHHYNNSIWHELILLHLNKMNYIITSNYEFPNQLYNQSLIFKAQREKFIEKNNCVSILSHFPIFLLDYFGIEGLKTKLLALNDK